MSERASEEREGGGRERMGEGEEEKSVSQSVSLKYVLNSKFSPPGGLGVRGSKSIGTKYVESLRSFDGFRLCVVASFSEKCNTLHPSVHYREATSRECLALPS